MKTDFLVIGSGVAGLFAAHKLSAYGEVTIITKKFDFESNTNYAQGGIASVFSKTDNPESHLKDTLDAGAGLCDIEATRILVEEGPSRVQELVDLGVPFVKDSKGDLDLGLEGGHRKNRIVHAFDRTGREVEQTLLSTVKANVNIKILEHHTCVDLITGHHLKNKPQSQEISCYGAYVLNSKNSEIFPILARQTILAAGGAGQVYLHTTNPSIATGDGVACAYRAGAVIKNMEFFQFHPTSLYHESGESFLISEAVRGKGGILKRINGEPFMKEYHPMADLAPRDIVARAIDNELKKSGESHVLLDVTHLIKPEIISHFPSIYEKCKSLGLDITETPIPVVPAAHYMCGGVATDVMGRTNINSLYACGEVACTGVHGGNRLASNSLLEGLVFSHRIAEHIISEKKDFTPEHKLIPEWNKEGLKNTEEWVLISHDLNEIKSIMNDYVGIVRSNLRLERAHRRIELIYKEVVDYYNRTIITNALLELRNLVQVADLVIRSAMMRKESRGLHYSTDYPENRNPSREDTVIVNQDLD
ncbi:MAG: L-aspartate oxidase [Leptospiraceae bacterium]|nr:L-aspartate oxidase [Leptospiraceae bacterium]MBK9497823.1 L-aspartate oxidase [Leptospiraceae bacterium]MBL0263241.1 L-aspartate oxidase [Leptospiraceae bacterium]